MTDGCDDKERDADVSLFNALYQEHYGSLYAYLLGHTAEGEAAADLLQETFVRVWRNRAQVRQVPPERRRFWLFAVARNIANDQHRRRAVRQRHEATLPETERAGDSSADPVRTMEARETAAAVDAAIARLPEALRTVLTLHLVGEMTSVEIGAALKKSPGTVRYQLAEARKRIAQELGLQNTAGGGDDEPL